MNRLQERYENEVVKSLMEKFNYSSKMQADRKSTRLNSSHLEQSRMPSSA